MDKKQTVSVFFGRFQPVHIGHLMVVKHALEHTDRILIIIGSAHDKQHMRNPIPSQMVKQLFKAYLVEHSIDDQRVNFAFLEDYMYNELKWGVEARNLISNYSNPENVYLTGYSKDNSSYYLNFFPEFKELKYQEFHLNLSSTDIRKDIVNGYFEKIKHVVPSNLMLHLDVFTQSKPQTVPFHTITNVIVSHCHILVKFDGESYSLPETTIKSVETMNESSLNLALSNIRLTNNILIARKHGEHTFDDPYRSLACRQITTSMYYQLGNNDSIPKLKHDNLKWLPIHKMKRIDFMADHFYIVKYFIGY